MPLVAAPGPRLGAGRVAEPTGVIDDPVLRRLPSRSDQKQRIVELLEEDIALGQLQPNARLQEEDLAERFGAGRHFVRAALAECERLGLVTRYPNRGAAVRLYSAREVEDLYEVRAVLEQQASRTMSLPAETSLVEKLCSLEDRRMDAVRVGDAVGTLRQDRLFHGTLMSACRNPQLREAVEIFAARAFATSFGPGSNTHLRTEAHDQHLGIIDALSGQSSSDLVRRIHEHREAGKRAYLQGLRPGPQELARIDARGQEQEAPWRDLNTALFPMGGKFTSGSLAAATGSGPRS